MTEFDYNNINNAGIGHKSFKLNLSYHPQVFYKKVVNFQFLSKPANKLVKKLRELMIVCRKNF